MVAATSPTCRSDRGPSERSVGYEAALAAVRARWPKACPRCGSMDIVPSFVVPEVWRCWGCPGLWGREFAVGGDG
jgi:hypothetical protein